MKLQVKVDGFHLTPRDIHVLEGRIERIERRVTRFDPDLVALEVVLEKRARREEYSAHARLVVMGRLLAARKNFGPTAQALIRESFEDLEEELSRFQAQLRGERWRRKRGAARWEQEQG